MTVWRISTDFIKIVVKHLRFLRGGNETKLYVRKNFVSAQTKGALTLTPVAKVGLLAKLCKVKKSIKCLDSIFSTAQKYCYFWLISVRAVLRVSVVQKTLDSWKCLKTLSHKQWRTKSAKYLGPSNCRPNWGQFTPLFVNCVTLLISSITSI